MLMSQTSVLGNFLEPFFFKYENAVYAKKKRIHYLCEASILMPNGDSQNGYFYLCAYAQADLRLCWSYIPHCWKFHVAAHFTLTKLVVYVFLKEAYTYINIHDACHECNNRK